MSALSAHALLTEVITVISAASPKRSRDGSSPFRFVIVFRTAALPLALLGKCD